ncbi:acyl-CoA thioesterase [Minwuia sp.]|uniref:acyl-CoA thioesterase n=1 Tax=Minwuia sp. TaxID=2493630 RepID=UPI003A900620
MKPVVSAIITDQPHFHDLDPMNIVWHGNYVQFFEKARAALLKKIGYGYDRMLAGGHVWPVIDLSVRYYRPLTLSQTFEVEAGIVEWENRLKISYLIRDTEERQKITRGYSVQVAVDKTTEEMLWETPGIFRDRLAPYLS